jgi:hypothetical protein
MASEAGWLGSFEQWCGGLEDLVPIVAEIDR